MDYEAMLISYAGALGIEVFSAGGIQEAGFSVILRCASTQFFCKMSLYMEIVFPHLPGECC